MTDETVDDQMVLLITTEAPIGQASKAISALEREGFEIEENETYETDDQVGYVISRE